MITIRHLTKVYGETRAVNDLSFDVQPGLVTGFLGPNGAGKSTTMRAIVGLERPTSGEALVDGRHLADYPAPLHEVGALLEARAIHSGRSARDHLLALAATNGIGAHRVDEVLDIVGLASVARRRAGAFSLGMGQRLGIATALLGDPSILILDEPANGLDPDGVLWIRTLIKSLAAEGRTVLVSSHLISEMALTADRLVIIGRGQLIADVTMTELLAETASSSLVVGSPRVQELANALFDSGATITDAGTPGRVTVSGMSAAQVGDLAATYGLPIHELTPQRQSLEEIYMRLTHESVQYQTSGPDQATGPDHTADPDRRATVTEERAA